MSITPPWKYGACSCGSYAYLIDKGGRLYNLGARTWPLTHILLLIFLHNNNVQEISREQLPTHRMRYMSFRGSAMMCCQRIVFGT